MKFDFDLLLLDETDPQGLIHKGQDGTGLNCSRALNKELSSDRQSQGILEMFLKEVLVQTASDKK